MACATVQRMVDIVFSSHVRDGRGLVAPLVSSNFIADNVFKQLKLLKGFPSAFCTLHTSAHSPVTSGGKGIAGRKPGATTMSDRWYSPVTSVASLRALPGPFAPVPFVLCDGRNARRSVMAGLKKRSEGNADALRQAHGSSKRTRERVLLFRNGKEHACVLRERRKLAVRNRHNGHARPRRDVRDRDDFLGVVAKCDGDQHIFPGHRRSHFRC